MSMPQMVGTTKGLMPVSQLRIVDDITLEDNARILKTQWFDGDECVRQDIAVSLLRGQTHELTGEF